LPSEELYRFITFRNFRYQTQTLLHIQFSAYLSRNSLLFLRKDGLVKYEEVDQEIQIQFKRTRHKFSPSGIFMRTQINTPSWGISRISQRKQNIPSVYFYPDSAGQGVNIYVLGSGAYVEHSDFEGVILIGE
jgi:hypothetical protein